MLRELSLGFEGAGANFSTTASGFEFLNIQGGVDFAPAEHFYPGPFVSFSLDQYSDISVDCSGPIPCMDFASIEGNIRGQHVRVSVRCAGGDRADAPRSDRCLCAGNLEERRRLGDEVASRTAIETPRFLQTASTDSAGAIRDHTRRAMNGSQGRRNR